jgi:hypothetical protein
VDPNAFMPAARDKIRCLRMLGLGDSDDQIVNVEVMQQFSDSDASHIDGSGRRSRNRKAVGAFSWGQEACDFP